jgi:diguanylate cyclase (GGDEF)-like protein
MLDVDLFKQINDLAGYQVGDCVLREVGQVLRSHLRAADVVARLGGDEFGIILRGVSRRPAAAVLERLRFEVTQHLKSRKLPAASLSAGYVVISRSRRGHAQDVFAAAAMSLQAAKQQVRPGGGTPLLPKPNPR